MILRRFNSTGIGDFRHFLLQCRETPDIQVPIELLEDAALTSIVEPEVEVQNRHFSNRRDAAEYLRDVLSVLPDRDVMRDSGLWSWLALYYFDEVCARKGGIRSVKNDYYYIFEADQARYFYRHLLFCAWRVVALSANFNRLFLDRPLSVFDQFTDEVMKRLYLTRIPCLFEVLDRLYWDETRKSQRAGIVDQKRVRPGNLRHRLPLRIRQLEMTYDLQRLSASQLIEILGDEFNFEPRTVVS
jgi:hypothetical protein